LHARGPDAEQARCLLAQSKSVLSCTWREVSQPMESSVPRRGGTCANCAAPLARPRGVERSVRCSACDTETAITEADEIAWRASVAVADVRHAVEYAEKTLRTSREILNRSRE
jgi:LSD1 subclass zinc finger protein